MHFFVQRSELRDLYDKVAAGERISEADALRLFETKDLNALGAIADLARQKKVGDRASYIVNRYINYSNYCILSCQFCSFARKKRDADGFQLTVPEMVEKAREALKIGITELHIVGGLHPSLPFSYYLDMLRELKGLDVSGTGVSPVRTESETHGRDARATNSASWQAFDKILNDANVVITPGSGFGSKGEGYFRISAFNSRANAEEVARRLQELKW